MTKSGFFLTSSFLDDLDVAFYVIDVSTSELLHVSAAAARIAGTAPGSGPLEMAMAGVIHEDDRPGVFACVAGLLEGGPPVSSQYRVFRTDGSVRVVAARTGRARLPDGRDVIIGQLTDLTDHLESERERLGHELTKRRLEALIDGIADAAAVLDRDFRVVAMNQAAVRASLLEKSKVMGHLAPDVVPLASGVIEAINEVFSSGQSRTVVYRSLISRRRLEVTVAPLEGMVALMSRDVEDALREQERFRTIVETQQEAVCVAAPDTTLRYANGALLRMVGGGVIGVRWIDHIPASERDRMVAHLQSLSPACPTKTIEYQQDTPDGRRVFQWCDTMIFNELGVAQELIGVGRDVTDERTRVVEQNAALMERELMLRELHHGVKNNLQIVASIVRLRLDALNDPVAIAIGREIEERVRVMGLIHDVLNAAKDPGLVDIDHLLTELIRLILQVHGRRDVHVTTTARLLRLRMDRALSVSRAVHELVCNALKHAFPAASDGHGHDHTDGDGACSCGCVLPHRVSVTLDADGDAVVLEVEDNGRGLPEVRQSPSGRRSWGLQIIDSIAQQQGGTFAVGSGAGGRGVRARLTLPGSG